MASLQVTISESVSLNNQPMEATYTNSIPSITQVFRRIISPIADTETTLYTTNDTVITGSQFDNDSVKYVRITNLAASTSYGWLRVSNGSNDEFDIKLYGGESFILSSHATSMNAVDAGALTLGTGEGDITDVTIKPITTSQDIEIFIASTAAA